MISVGIDVSKDKSTVCILKPYGEIVCSPYEMNYVVTKMVKPISRIRFCCYFQKLSPSKNYT